MASSIIGSDHPALPGHFPGHPVVPAALLLARVSGAARVAHPGLMVRGIRKAKFLRALAPDEPFEIALEAVADDGLRFVCRGEAGVIAEGRLTVVHAAHD